MGDRKESASIPQVVTSRNVVAFDKVLERLFVRPLTGDQIGIASSLTSFQRVEEGMALRSIESIDDSRKFFLKGGLFSRQSVIIHADSDHGFVLLKKVYEILQQGMPHLITRQAA